MTKKINHVVPKANLASALRANLLNRKKQLRARQTVPVLLQTIAESTKIEHDNHIVKTTGLLDSVDEQFDHKTCKPVTIIYKK